MAQPQSSTSSTTAKGAVPTQGVTIGHVYAYIPRNSHKEARKVDTSFVKQRHGKLNVLTTSTFCIHATTEDIIL